MSRSHRKVLARKKVLGLSDLPEIQINSRRVFVRVDFNVPLQGGKIDDDTRIKAALETIGYLLKRKAAIILGSHLGRPNGRPEPNYSLKPVAQRLSKLLGQEVKFVDYQGKLTEWSLLRQKIQPGEVYLLENLRFYKEEEENDPNFSKELSRLAELYVNDAFGTAHRAHASTVGIVEYLRPAVAGFLMKKELENLGKLFEQPERPFVSIVGGSKISSKLEVIRSLIRHSDVVLIGGGMAYTFIKAQGGEIGESIYEKDKLKTALDLLEFAEKNNTALILPDDIVCLQKEQSSSGKVASFKAGQIPANYEGCDLGALSRANFTKIIQEAKSILWNGPVGIFEDKRFEEGSRQIAQARSQAKKMGALTLIGGGDSVSAIHKFGYLDSEFDHVSTGGGASLEFLSGKLLEGIRVLDSD